MTAEEIRTAAELYESGKTLKEIEAVIFYTANTIRVNLKKFGINMRTGSKISTFKEKTDIIVELYRAGYSTPRIAAEMSCTATTVIKVLKNEGVEIRKKSSMFTEKEIADFAELYNSGHTCAQICKKYCCTPETIARYLKALGIKRPHKQVPG